MYFGSRMQLLLLLLLLLADFSTSRDHKPVLQVLDDAGVTMGGTIFRQQMGETGAFQLLKRAIDFTLRLLRQNGSSRRQITLVVSSLPMDEVSSTTSIDNMSVIELSAEHLSSFPEGNVSLEIQGLVYQQMASCLLNSAELAPPGLVDAIAKFVRLEAGLGPWNQWDPKQFQSDASSPWESSSSPWERSSSSSRSSRDVYTGAHFVGYLEHQVLPGFVALLNGKMAQGWNEDYPSELLHASVTELWRSWLSGPHPSAVDFHPQAPSSAPASPSSRISTGLLMILSTICLSLRL